MSASMRPTRKPSLAIAVARFTASVVLPTPPLPEPTAIIFDTPGRVCGPGGVGACAIREPLFTDWLLAIAHCSCAHAQVRPALADALRHGSGVVPLPSPGPGAAPAPALPAGPRQRK